MLGHWNIAGDSFSELETLRHDKRDFALKNLAPIKHPIVSLACRASTLSPARSSVVIANSSLCIRPFSYTWYTSESQKEPRVPHLRYCVRTI